MAGARRIYKAVRDADKKLAVVTTQRFDQDKQTLMRLVAGKQYGRLNYIVARSTHNYRRRGSWGGMRHQMADPLLIEDGVQHFDLFRAITQSEAKTVRGVSWNPPWGDFRGDSTAMVIIEMENGVHCLYEGAAANASTMDGWGNEYVRAECESGTLVLDHRVLSLLKGEALEEPRVTDVPLLDQPLWGDAWLTEQFCDYINDRAKPDHRLKESVKSMALTFAAVEACRTGKIVDVQAYLKEQFNAPAPAIA
jgi:predicted dehydrogenase